MKNGDDGDRHFRYIFRLEGGREEQFEVRIDHKTLQLVPGSPLRHPRWVELDFFQCPHCPLNSTKTSHCPAAVVMASVVNSFDGTVSYDPVHLTVETEQRTVSQHTTAQRAIGSLLGVLIASSGCPYTRFLRPMAWFHLPLSDEDETIYRATSMYLLAQYFITARGGEPDMSLAGLVTLYEKLQQVNFGLADRLREATRTDSSINAIVLLDVFTRTVPMAIAEFLEEIGPLFRHFPDLKSQ